MAKHEKEPKPDPWFRLEFDSGEEMLCSKSNTTAFLHSDFPEGDHLWVVTQDDPEQDAQGKYCFRPQLDNFDEVVGWMETTGFLVIKSDKPSPNDLKAYEEYKEARAERLQQTQPIPIVEEY